MGTDTAWGRVAAIVLAGGALEEKLGQVVAVKHKAWIPLGGRMMIERVLDALEGCPRIGERVLVAPDEDVPASVRRRVDAVAPPGDCMPDSFAAGIARLRSTHQTILAIPCDMPLLEPASIEDFLDRCSRRTADIWYSFVRRETSEARYPGLRHTWVKTGEGTFCGGGLVLFRPHMVARARSFLAQLAEARKRPWRLASLLGPKIILKLLLRTVTIAEAEERMSKLLGGVAVGIESPCPDVGFNVDAPEELATAQMLVGG